MAILEIVEPKLCLPPSVKAPMTVIFAEWAGDFRVRVGFKDQTETMVDFGPYLASHSHPYINPYRDIEAFKTFYIDGGNLVWGEDWDMIFPNWKLYRGYL